VTVGKEQFNGGNFHTNKDAGGMWCRDHTHRGLSSPCLTAQLSVISKFYRNVLLHLSTNMPLSKHGVSPCSATLRKCRQNRCQENPNRFPPWRTGRDHLDALILRGWRLSSNNAEAALHS